MTDERVEEIRQMDERWYDWPEWAKDALVVESVIQFGWRDRLRILCGRTVYVTSKTFVRERTIGEHLALSRTWVAPLWHRRRDRIGAVTNAPDKTT